MNSYRDVIDQYLSRSLDGERLKDFEAMMSLDPNLREQVEFEQSVMEGISDYRKEELKARLDAVDVSPVWWWGSAGNVTKALVTAVSVGIVGYMGYVYFDQEQPSPGDGIAVQVDYPADDLFAGIQFNPDLIPQISKKVSVTGAQKVRKESKPMVRDYSVRQSRAVTTLSEVTSIMDEPEERTFDLDVNVPNPVDISDDALSTSSLEDPVQGEGDALSTDRQSIDILTVSKNNEKLRYKYYDGKLYLYGDFDEQPYELLEINAKTERKLFLYHKEKYYSIRTSDKTQDLEPIYNTTLLKELHLFRTGK